jgi:hypothetical protein
MKEGVKQDSTDTLYRKESRAMIDTKTTNEKMNEKIEVNAMPPISQDALAHLGEGELAYVKAVSSDEVRKLFPQAPELAPGLTLFALHAANGTPIMLTDSREAAVANAWSQELQTVSVH